MKTYDQQPDQMLNDHALVLPLDILDRTQLPLVGGKAAQLGELIRAGFAVPAGFCITTTAYARVSAPTDTVRQAALAAAMRTAILHAPVPSDIAAAITDAYQGSAAYPIALVVESSAMAAQP